MGEQNAVAVVQDSRLEYKLHILEKHNYTIWKQHTQNILEAKGLLDIVTNPNAQDAVKERQARALLTSALNDDNQMKVINCATARTIWTRLESIFENKTSFEKQNLIGKLHNYKIKSLNQISQGISEMENMAAKLNLLGETVSQESLMSAILRSLPSSMKTFVTVWKGTAAAERTIDNLLSRVMSEVEDSKEPEEKALFGARNPGHSKFRKPGPRGFRKSNFNKPAAAKQGDKKVTGKCHHCGIPGHWKKDCRKLKNEQKASSSSQPKPGENRGRPEGQNSGAPNSNLTALTALTASTGTMTTWVADSGASVHITPNFKWISEYEEFDDKVNIGLGNQQQMQALGSGKIHTKFGIMSKVLYVPDASNNLFSESCAAMKGIRIVTNRDKKYFMVKNKKLFEASLCNGIYIINFEVNIRPQPRALKAATINDWHRRFGHVSTEIIKRMANLKIVDGLEITEESERNQCEDCIIGKCHKVSHPSRTTERARSSGQSLHFDTVGPFQEQSLGGSKYFVLCKDEFSSFRIIKFVSSKSEIADEVKTCISQAEFDTGNKVLQMVCDNGSEFLNESLTSFLRERGVNLKTSVPYTPEQNGFIERDNRTVIEAGKTMLIQAKLPKTLWAEAMSTAVYVLNRTINTNSDVTPYELWTGKRPNVKNLRIFGQKAVTLIPSNQRLKLDNKGEKLIFIGYTDRHNTFRFFDPRNNRVKIRCDANFINEERQDSTTNNGSTMVVVDSVKKTSDPLTDETFVQKPDSPSKKAESAAKRTPEPSPRINKKEESEAPNDTAPKSEACKTEDEEVVLVEKKSGCAIIPKNLLIRNKPPEIVESRLRPRTDRPTYYHANISTIEAENEPQNFKEAMDRGDRDLWKKAMEEEMASLKKNGVWTLVDRPDENIVTNKWVLKVKRKPDGQIERYKARLVARGFSQVYGIDYNETFAPVANSTSIRLLFAYSAVEKLEMGQFDVKTAFLYGELDETIYMEQPEGFCEDTNKVCLLQKSLYGLKQAPRQWNIKFSSALKEMNLKMSEHDNCIYYRNDPLMIIAIYVDDGIVLARSKQEIQIALDMLKQRFDMNTTDTATFLGFQVYRGANGEVALYQEGYVNKIVKKYQMNGANAVDAPCVSTKEESDSKPLDPNFPYREAVGSLMYAAVNTRIDIAYAVGKVSRKVADPTEADWRSVKRIFRYLKGHDKLCLNYNEEKDRGLIAYCDADFAGDNETSKSTTGSVVMYGGAPIQWRSKRQTVVTTSSTEAELDSLFHTSEDVLWVRALAIELGIIKEDETVPIYCDNQSTIRIVHSEKSMQRTRHMRVKAAFVREKIESGEIAVEHINTDNQLADMLTKATTSKKFIANRSWLMTILSFLTCLLVAMPTVVYSAFERVDPLVWTQTGKYVDHGLATYVVELRFISPCDQLRRLPRYVSVVKHKRQLPPVTQHQSQYPQFPQEPQYPQDIAQQQIPQPPHLIMNDYEIGLKEALDHCGQIYIEYILAPLREISASRLIADKSHIGINLDRPKRFVNELVTGMFFTNIVCTYLDKFFTGRSEAELKERQHVVEEKIVKVTNELNMTEIAEKAMGESIISMAEIVKTTQQRLSGFVNNFPHLVFTTNYFVSLMSKKSALINRLRYGSKHRKLDLLSLSELLDSDWLVDLEESSAVIRHIDSPAPNVLRIEFQARKRDPDTNVYRVDPFRYWANLTEMPVLMEYVGERYLIHNRTNNCVRAIDEPSQPFVTAKCETPNGADKRLALWQRVLEVQNPYEQPANTTLKESWPYTYVYCYRLHITMKGKTSRCPPYVFRVNATVLWNTTDIRYEPQHYEYDKSLEVLPITHEVHHVHFLDAEHLIDENAAIDKILNLKGEIKALQQENVAIQLPVKGGNVSYSTAFYSSMWVTIILFTIVLGVVIFNALRQEKMGNSLRTIVDEKFGEGVYEEIRMNKLPGNNGHKIPTNSTHATTGSAQLNVNIHHQAPNTPATPSPQPGYRYKADMA